MVDAEEETDSDDDQAGCVYTVEGEEDTTELFECSAKEMLKPTPWIPLTMAMAMTMALSNIYKVSFYLPCMACPDTGCSTNVISEQEAKRMCLRWQH